MADPSHDPRDDLESRPQVGFSIDVTNSTFRGRFLPLVDAWIGRGVRYRDILGVDSDRCVIRFHWDDAILVDPTAEWLAAYPFVSNIRRHYGGPLTGTGSPPRGA